MPSPKQTYELPAAPSSLRVKEEQVEYGFISKLQALKYEYRSDIRDRASLERNFREKFEALNRVRLSDGEFARLLDEIVTADVFTAAFRHEHLGQLNTYVAFYKKHQMTPGDHGPHAEHRPVEHAASGLQVHRDGVV